MAKIFISYVREDWLTARRLYKEMQRRGHEPWIDKFDLMPGEKWKEAVGGAIRDSDLCVCLISMCSVNKKGFVQRELKVALEVMKEMPDGEIFIIPVRLDDCRPRSSVLADLHWVDLFPDLREGLNALMASLAAVALYQRKNVEKKVSAGHAEPNLDSIHANGITGHDVIVSEQSMGIKARREKPQVSTAASVYSYQLGYVLVELCRLSLDVREVPEEVVGTSQVEIRLACDRSLAGAKKILLMLEMGSIMELEYDSFDSVHVMSYYKAAFEKVPIAMAYSFEAGVHLGALCHEIFIDHAIATSEGRDQSERFQRRAEYNTRELEKYWTRLFGDGAFATVRSFRDLINVELGRGARTDDDLMSLLGRLGELYRQSIDEFLSLR